MSKQGVDLQAGRRAVELRRFREPGPRYKWVALTNTTMGVLMVVINGSITIIALPDIFRGIDSNPLAPGNSSYFLWVLMGFLLVTSVLVLTFGRLGDMYGRVRMYNLGFVIFTALFDPPVGHLDDGPGGRPLDHPHAGRPGRRRFARIRQLERHPDRRLPGAQRGFALGINSVAAIAGSFIGLVLGGVLAPVDWRLVFLVSVPFGVFGTAWAYLKLVDNGVRVPARIDWLGNVAFAVGLTALLDRRGVRDPAVRRPSHGLDQPLRARHDRRRHRLARSCSADRDRVADPMFRLHLFKIRAFAAGNLAGFLGAPVPRRPAVHADHLAAGDLAAAATATASSRPRCGPASNGPPDRRFPRSPDRPPGSSRTATGPGCSPPWACSLTALGFALLELFPIDFDYPWFGPAPPDGPGDGAVRLAQPGRHHEQPPPRRTGRRRGMTTTFQNSATVLSIGIFFTVITLGLAASLPGHLYAGPHRPGVPSGAARQIGHLPPDRGAVRQLPRLQPDPAAARARPGCSST